MRQVLIAGGAIGSPRRTGLAIDQLQVVLSELWLLDEQQPGSWSASPCNPLDLMIEIAPALWDDPHAELIVDDLRWPAHGEGPYPHAHLLAELDTKR